MKKQEKTIETYFRDTEVNPGRKELKTDASENGLGVENRVKDGSFLL